VTIEAQIRSGEWTDPERGKVKLGDYGSAVEDDKLLPHNRAGSAGPGAEDAGERPVLTVAQVFELAGQVGCRPVGNIRKIRLAKRPRRPGFDEANPAETIEQRGDAC